MDVDYIREHLKEIDVKNVFLYEDFKALHKEDEELTKLILEL